MLGFLLIYFYFPFASPFFNALDCKFAEAVMGFEWLDRMAVLSANVLRTVLGDWGMSAV